MLKLRALKRGLFALLCIAICASAIATTPVYADERDIRLGGFAAGFCLNTTTVEVVGVCEVLTDSGMKSPAKESGVKTGDIIERINGLEINGVSDVNRALTIPGADCKIEIARGEKTLTLTAVPVKDKASGERRLGLLVKDSVNGVGTVTFVDKTNNVMATLGHPVSGSDKKMLAVRGGKIYGCAIYGVKRGEKGRPGELKGSIESEVFAEARGNCACGVYGDLADKSVFDDLQRIETATISQAKMGKATIFSTVDGNEVEQYDISIVKIDVYNKDNRNFVIRVEDDDLIAHSGGIVQGMSGSPIVQNGKLIGAVTHVFVNDPAMGYGIGIEKMLASY